MDVAHQLIEAADDLNSLHGTAVIADEQTKGRGRFGRKWESARGEDLLASMILCPRTAIAGRLTTSGIVGSSHDRRRNHFMSLRNQVAKRRHH